MLWLFFRVRQHVFLNVVRNMKHRQWFCKPFANLGVHLDVPEITFRYHRISYQWKKRHLSRLLVREFFVSWTFFDAKNTKHSASRHATPKNEQFALKCIKLFLLMIRERGSLRVTFYYVVLHRKIPSTYQSPLRTRRTRRGCNIPNVTVSTYRDILIRFF